MPVGVFIGVTSALVTAVVTEVYCHRSVAHRAFQVRPALARVLDIYFWVIVGTDPEVWAAVHRLHHRYADTPQDPHSPVRRRPLLVLAGSAYLFAQARARVPVGAQRPWATLPLRGLLVAFYWTMFGPMQVLTMLVVHLICYLGIMGTVNTVGHLFGRKPHPEASGYDVGWLAIPLLGHDTTTPTTPIRLRRGLARWTPSGRWFASWVHSASSPSTTGEPGRSVNRAVGRRRRWFTVRREAATRSTAEVPTLGELDSALLDQAFTLARCRGRPARGSRQPQPAPGTRT